MSFHHDLDQWLYLSKKENCPYCCKEADPVQPITLKDFKYSELCAHPQVCLKGTCYLITKEHYIELYDLNDAALLGFMKEVHMHLFPRTIGDPFGGVPIDFNRIDPPVYQGNEFERFVKTMQARLEKIDIQ